MSLKTRGELSLVSLTAAAFSSYTYSTYFSLQPEDFNYAGHIFIGTLSAHASVYANMDMAMTSNSFTTYKNLLSTATKFTTSSTEQWLFTGASLLPLGAYGRIQVRIESGTNAVVGAETIAAKFLVDR